MELPEVLHKLDLHKARPSVSSPTAGSRKLKFNFQLPFFPVLRPSKRAGAMETYELKLKRYHGWRVNLADRHLGIIAQHVPSRQASRPEEAQVPLKSGNSSSTGITDGRYIRAGRLLI